mmetsp:Transcript_10415/g.33665  ORF Transcript_10415/g.33665 Transcript_10415/m.33665 type:complete len:323 (+) Transcript_10415:366-1334(+)
MPRPRCALPPRFPVSGQKGRGRRCGAHQVGQAFREYCTEKGFVFHDRPYQLNIFGLRNVSRESGTFDDNVCLLFRDDRGWVLEVYVATTDPGTAWLVKGGPTGRGTAILVPGQYEDTYDVAKHKGKYNALCQRPGKSVAVWRDNNRDDKLDFRGPKDVGVFWINIHNGGIPNARSYANRSLTIKDLVRKYSAGCQVIATQADFKNFMGQVYKSQRHGYRTFTYTLLDEGHDAFRRRIQRALGGGGYTAPAPSAPPAPPAAQWSPPPPAPAAAAAEGRKVHVVGQGDTLWGISRAYGVSVADLERCNPGLSSDIHPGDKISIP